ncbi:hypothetical protein [Pantoea sp. A4]|uniref:hypothetical protein n=1 Tax=Pantoea sp. A4 TaxID=1225184 RepID=UPI00036E7C3A|nr:hypothetical protein [Pantoea sp. A4]
MWFPPPTTPPSSLIILKAGELYGPANIVPGGLNGYSGAGNASASLGDPRMIELSMKLDF